jgi:predicted DNA-binding helix-hairpin-helix protein
MPRSTTPLAHRAEPASAIRSAAAGSARPKASGICHSYAPDGRCISLLKILFTNFCVYDCLYCVNRVSSNVPRARFRVDEVVDPDARFLSTQLH